VYGRHSGIGLGADRIDREAPSSRNPPGQYLSSHMDNTGVCARARYGSSGQDNRNSPFRQQESDSHRTSTLHQVPSSHSGATQTSADFLILLCLLAVLRISSVTPVL